MWLAEAHIGESFSWLPDELYSGDFDYDDFFSDEDYLAYDVERARRKLRRKKRGKGDSDAGKPSDNDDGRTPGVTASGEHHMSSRPLRRKKRRQAIGENLTTPHAPAAEQQLPVPVTEMMRQIGMAMMGIPELIALDRPTGSRTSLQPEDNREQLPATQSSHSQTTVTQAAEKPKGRRKSDQTGGHRKSGHERGQRGPNQSSGRDLVGRPLGHAKPPSQVAVPQLTVTDLLTYWVGGLGGLGRVVSGDDDVGNAGSAGNAGNAGIADNADNADNTGNVGNAGSTDSAGHASNEGNAGGRNEPAYPPSHNASTAHTAGIADVIEYASSTGFEGIAGNDSSTGSAHKAGHDDIDTGHDVIDSHGGATGGKTGSAPDAKGTVPGRDPRGHRKPNESSGHIKINRQRGHGKSVQSLRVPEDLVTVTDLLTYWVGGLGGLGRVNSDDEDTAGDRHPITRDRHTTSTKSHTLKLPSSPTQIPSQTHQLSSSPQTLELASSSSLTPKPSPPQIHPLEAQSSYQSLTSASSMPQDLDRHRTPPSPQTLDRITESPPPTTAAPGDQTDDSGSVFWVPSASRAAAASEDVAPRAPSTSSDSSGSVVPLKRPRRGLRRKQVEGHGRPSRHAHFDESSDSSSD